MSIKNVFGGLAVIYAAMAGIFAVAAMWDSIVLLWAYYEAILPESATYAIIASKAVWVVINFGPSQVVWSIFHFPASWGICVLLTVVSLTYSFLYFWKRSVAIQTA